MSQRDQPRGDDLAELRRVAAALVEGYFARQRRLVEIARLADIRRAKRVLQ